MIDFCLPVISTNALGFEVINSWYFTQETNILSANIKEAITDNILLNFVEATHHQLAGEEPIFVITIFKLFRAVLLHGANLFTA